MFRMGILRQVEGEALTLWGFDGELRPPPTVQ
jgi:hypothetical protein